MLAKAQHNQVFLTKSVLSTTCFDRVNGSFQHVFRRQSLYTATQVIGFWFIQKFEAQRRGPDASRVGFLDNADRMGLLVFAVTLAGQARQWHLAIPPEGGTANGRFQGGLVAPSFNDRRQSIALVCGSYPKRRGTVRYREPKR